MTEKIRREHKHKLVVAGLQIFSTTAYIVTFVMNRELATQAAVVYLMTLAIPVLIYKTLHHGQR